MFFKIFYKILDSDVLKTVLFRIVFVHKYIQRLQTQFIYVRNATIFHGIACLAKSNLSRNYFPKLQKTQPDTL